MVAQLVAERDFRGPGCTDACQVVRAIVPGRFGRTEMMLHDPAAHEEHGRRLIELSLGARGIVETGPLSVALDRVEVAVDGRIVLLTPNETRLVMALARKAGDLASCQYLLEATWPADYLIGGWQDNQHLLRVNLARLRSRLGRAGDLITTVKALGYRLELIAPGATPLPRQPLSGGKGKAPGVWAISWQRCLCCGRTDRLHYGHGRCSVCRSLTGRRGDRWPHYGPCGAPPIEPITGGTS